MFYCREDLWPGVHIVKTHFDSIVWMRLNSDYFELENDIYLCASYIWGDNSPAHNIVDSDLFDILENDILQFQSKGAVFVLGDMNGRVGLKCDYIIYDKTNAVTDHDNYVPDIPLTRLSTDSQFNTQGLRLLDLCKSTGLRICNGRFENTESYTFYSTNGCSVIDYLLRSVYTERERKREHERGFSSCNSLVISRGTV